MDRTGAVAHTEDVQADAAAAAGVQVAFVSAMRIRVSGIDTPVADEKRAYAEYRFFTALARYEPQVGVVDVVVGRESEARRQFLCAVTVDLGRFGHIKAQARAAHPSAAIDRAADRTAWLIGRHIGRDFSLKSPAFSS
jgi:ribosomal subunit interface protein